MRRRRACVVPAFALALAALGPIVASAPPAPAQVVPPPSTMPPPTQPPTSETTEPPATTAPPPPSTPPTTAPRSTTTGRQASTTSSTGSTTTTTIFVIQGEGSPSQPGPETPLEEGDDIALMRDNEFPVLFPLLGLVGILSTIGLLAANALAASRDEQHAAASTSAPEA